MAFYLNLPVRDPKAAQAFYNGLGFATDPRFEDENASNAMIDDSLVVMLLSQDYFRSFIDRPLADTRAAIGALYCIDRDNRAAVDALTESALRLGAQEMRPAQDMGFMYLRAFADPDGHVWEVMWMDPAGPPQG